jgi:ribosomal protein S6
LKGDYLLKMDTLYFLKKLYKTSKSAVLIVDISENFFWHSNLEAIRLSPTIFRNDNENIKIFGSTLGELYPGEGLANIRGRQFPYTVKTYSDRTAEYVIIEIRSSSVTTDFINSDNIDNLSKLTSKNIDRNTEKILNVTNALFDGTHQLTSDDYDLILGAVQDLRHASKAVSNLEALKRENNGMSDDKINVTQTVLAFANDCKSLLYPKKINVEFNCSEEILGHINRNILYNLCSSLVSSVIKSSDGYVDNISIRLEMNGAETADLWVIADCRDKVGRFVNLKRAKNSEELMEMKNTTTAFGNDVFYIREFCNSFNTTFNTSAKPDKHHYEIIMNLPYCSYNNIELFHCDDYIRKNTDKFSNLNLNLFEAMSLLK